MGESRLFARVPGARFLLGLAIGCGLASAVLVVIEALLLSAVVGAAFLGTGPTDRIPGLLVAMVLAVFGRFPLELARARLGEGAARRLTDRLRTDLTDSLLEAGPIGVGRERRGELVSVMVGGLDAIADFASFYMPARWLAITVPLLVLGVVLLIDPPSVLVLLATGPLLVLMLAVIGSRARVLTQRRFDDMRWLGAFFLDVLQGIATLKMFGRSVEQVDNIQRLGRRYADTSMEVLRTAFQTSLVLEWGASIAMALVAVEISLRLMLGAIGFERALAVLVITPGFFLPLRHLAGQYHLGAAGRAAAARIDAILDGAPPTDGTGEGTAVHTSGPPTIRLVAVAAGYPDRAGSAVADIDLTLSPDRLVVLSGPTGAGKSTILSLLLRFLDRSAGQISVDGHDVATIDDDAWRANVAWVPQTPHLVHGTVAENLRLGRSDATDQDVLEALEEVGAMAFVGELPAGLDTVIGPGGHGLSGGQVRRLAIARALVADRQVVLLDEPTADLDPAAARQVAAAIVRLRGRRTVLVASHDPRLTNLADEVVKIDRGRVVATGSPRDKLIGRPSGPGSGAHEVDPTMGPALDDAEGGGDAAPTPVSTERRAFPTDGRRDLRRLLGLLRPQRRWIAIAAGLSFLAVGANVALAAMSAFLISRAAVVTNVADVALAITAVRVLAISRAGFRYLERLLTHRATFEALTTLRAWFYRSIEPLAPAGLAGHRTGDLLARIGADIDTLETFPARVLLPPAVAVGVGLLGCLVLGFFDPVLGLVVLAGLLLAAVVVPLALRGAARRTGDAAIERRAELSSMAVDLVTAVGDLVVLDGERRHRAALLGAGAGLDGLRRQGALLRATGDASTGLLAGLTSVAVLAIGVGLVAGGRLDGVFLALVVLAAVACFEAAGPMAHAVEALPRHQRAAARLFELVDDRPAVADPSTPAARPITHDLMVRGLTFRYEPGDRAALDDVSLSIPAGGRLGVIGPSGAGKSTLVSLLLRFWEYRDGEILVDGRDLHEYRADDVRAWVGVVDQRVHLFNATIRDNLAVADADATDADMEAACRIAQLHDFITGLPAVYGTRIGQDGLQLSGGQRQQLAIARMILKAAPIVVLDEATAHLDEATERRLFDALEPFLARRTVLMISHRAAITERVDRVVRLDAGRVVGGPVGLLRASSGG